MPRPEIWYGALWATFAVGVLILAILGSLLGEAPLTVLPEMEEGEPWTFGYMIKSVISAVFLALDWERYQ